MSLWTCPTHGLHGPMPGNVCPTCGAAMSVATVHEAWVPLIDPDVLKEAFRTLDARSASVQSLSAPQQGANAAEQASGDVSPTRGPSHVAEVAYDFVRYYVAGTTGCRNCGGMPHSSECFVGRFVVALALDYNERTR